MLARLVRLLRAAGEDAALARPGAPDEELLALARREDRTILTRDRGLAVRAQGRRLASDSLAGQAEELARTEPIDWTSRRLTRCLMDNTPLRAASPQEIARMPASSQAGGGPFTACPACGRVYWPGSHVRRLQARLDRLAAISAGAQVLAQDGPDDQGEAGEPEEIDIGLALAGHAEQHRHRLVGGEEQEGGGEAGEQAVAGAPPELQEKQGGGQEGHGERAAQEADDGGMGVHDSASQTKP
jgi:uncharacterized protein with PIN domain